MSLKEISARAPREAVHQGLLLEARPLAPIDVAELPTNGLVLVLDQITDPHNVGAISAHRGRLRGRRARLPPNATRPNLPERWRNLPPAGWSTCRFAASPIWRGQLADMGDMGFWRIGLDSDAPVRLFRRGALAPACFGPGRRRQGAETAHARALRCARPPRSARRDSEPQRLERLRRRARARPRAIACRRMMRPLILDPGRGDRQAGEQTPTAWRCGDAGAAWAQCWSCQTRPPRTAGSRPRGRRRFGSAAKYFQARPGKTKQECLDLPRFIRQN